MIAPTYADDGFGPANTQWGNPEDFQSSPYMDFGEFNEDEDEAAMTQYLQYGRFFGVSIGVGSHGATGNRGILWSGGFPLIDFKIHYWFDFNFALQMGFQTTSHFYTRLGERTDVNLNRIGIDLKYYFDTRDLSSAVTFAGPYLLLGGGSFSKTENNLSQDLSESDSTFGLSAGFGLEFTINPKKVYFFFEGRYDLMSNFKDTQTTDFEESNGLTDLTGNFYTFVGGFLFTW